jgi:hypothetical protein
MPVRCCEFPHLGRGPTLPRNELCRLAAVMISHESCARAAMKRGRIALRPIARRYYRCRIEVFVSGIVSAKITTPLVASRLSTTKATLEP